MPAAAPGSSRCSGSGSFLASARGCRPPALVDRVSRCFVVSLEVFDAWLPPRRRRRVAPPATTSKRVSGRRPRAARMSICAPSVAANSSAAAARLNHLARGMSASPARAQARRKSRSEATRRRAAGCTTLTATRSPRRPPFVTSFLRTCAGVVVGSLSRASSSLPLARPQKTRRRLVPPSAPGRRSPCRRAPRRRRARRASRARATPRGRAPCRATRAPAPGLANGRSGRRTRAGSGPRATRPTARA